MMYGAASETSTMCRQGKNKLACFLDWSNIVKLRSNLLHIHRDRRGHKKTTSITSGSFFI